MRSWGSLHWGLDTGPETGKGQRRDSHELEGAQEGMASQTSKGEKVAKHLGCQQPNREKLEKETIVFRCLKGTGEL